MAPQKRAVVKYVDGTILKGHAAALFRFSRVIELVPLDAEEPIQIPVKEIKAVFFVRTFQGRRFSLVKSRERTDGRGRRARIVFTDGEKIDGFVLGYNPHEPLIEMVPTRVDSNNELIYCNRAAVERIEWLDKKKEKTTVRTEDYF